MDPHGPPWDLMGTQYAIPYAFICIYFVYIPYILCGYSHKDRPPFRKCPPYPTNLQVR